MENKSINTAIGNLEPNGYKMNYQGGNANNNLVYEHLENYLNSRILKITAIIKNQYPELLQYLKEMPETIHSEMSPEIRLNKLKTYGDSLNSILKKYKMEHALN